jgi:hypothetical protein
VVIPPDLDVHLTSFATGSRVFSPPSHIPFSIHTTPAHRNHGYEHFEVVREAMGKEGDAHLDGWSRRCWKDNHSLQAQAR